MVTTNTKRPAPRAAATHESADVKALAAQFAELQAQLKASQAQVATLTQIVANREEAPPFDEQLYRPKKEEEEKKEEDFFVTVLYGWPHTPPNKVAWIDGTKFVGGVAKGVPNSIAQHWLKGTRADGKPVMGRVMVHVLSEDATPADYGRATGTKPMSPAEMASMLDGLDIDALRAAMGVEKFDALAASLTSHVTTKVANK